MRIAVIGMGGLGGYFGGKLALAYVTSQEHQVYFVARGEHLARIKDKGIIVRADDGNFTAMPTLATHQAGDIGKADLVLFCVKSYDFEEAAGGMEGIVGENTLILPLQNGVDKRGRMEKILGKGIVLDGCVYMAVHIESPGVIKQSGELRKLLFGRDPRDVPGLKGLEALFKGAGIDAELTGDINLPVWTKYIMICSLAAATAYFRETVGSILDDPGKKAFLKGLAAEVEEVARRKGIHYPHDIIEKTMNVIKTFPYDTKTSMQRDFEQGKRTELDIFSGSVVIMGEGLGIGTPLHREVYQALK